jgi:hypothetical protein
VREGDADDDDPGDRGPGRQHQIQERDEQTEATAYGTPMISSTMVRPCPR